MIIVTSVRNDIAIAVIEGGIFDPDETAILKLAYDRAAGALCREYDLTESAKTKLAKTILRIGRMTLAAGRGLTLDPDVQRIASAASIHLLSCSAQRTARLFSPPPAFQTASVHHVWSECDSSGPDRVLHIVRDA